ncbi:DUF6686 family protein [Mangrovibacterium sp.]|uniref:DUF6686 family protein n=1 Tax=Mangrovibacterium sp. TaxID=1961364 RepID=UPI003568450F
MIQGKGEQTINQTVNGRIYKCAECDKFHVNYKNLSFSFAQEEYENFQNYMRKLDVNYWAQQNEHRSGERKIMIPINHKNLILSFRTDEIDEIKALLADHTGRKPRFQLLKTRNFEFQISDN